MIHEKYRTTIRFNQTIKQRMDDIIHAFPSNFKTYSHVFRAGVMALYNERISKKEVDSNELLHRKG